MARLATSQGLKQLSPSWSYQDQDVLSRAGPDCQQQNQRQARRKRSGALPCRPRTRHCARVLALELEKMARRHNSIKNRNVSFCFTSLELQVAVKRFRANPHLSSQGGWRGGWRSPEWGGGGRERREGGAPHLPLPAGWRAGWVEESLGGHRLDSSLEWSIACVKFGFEQLF